MQWPSLYALGWLVMYSLISHWMVITEEEHLTRIFGEEYLMYFSEVPRYLGIPKKVKEASAKHPLQPTLRLRAPLRTGELYR